MTYVHKRAAEPNGRYKVNARFHITAVRPVTMLEETPAMVLMCANWSYFYRYFNTSFLTIKSKSSAQIMNERALKLMIEMIVYSKTGSGWLQACRLRAKDVGRKYTIIEESKK
jgi:hypothetical protein